MYLKQYKVLGEKNGWYYATWLWKLRGMIDIIFGGAGHKEAAAIPLTYVLATI